jgi:hypothetical protein
VKAPEALRPGRHFVRRKGFNVRISSLLKSALNTLLLLALICAAAVAQSAQQEEAAKLLPDQLAGFRAQSAPAPIRPATGSFETRAPEAYGVTSEARRAYTSADGKAFEIRLTRTDSDGAAYSLFTRLANRPGAETVKLGEIGTISLSDQKSVSFAKGRGFATVNDLSKGDTDPQALADFARAFASTLEGGENGLPVLVSHLPEWNKKVTEGVGYAVTLPALQQAAGNRPALDAVSFEGGAEAVTAEYNGARLVIVEFTTPQHAFDADAAVTRRIGELRAAGQPVPSSYKRVGNYSVFVFDAPDSAAAEKLVSAVKYEKDVRWLGHNPHEEEIATRAYTSTMGGVILTTLITTGLAILLCLGVGGAIGGVVFLHRRARHAEQEIYTDAGGMVRLNIEDLNTPPSAAKLLGRGED